MVCRVPAQFWSDSAWLDRHRRRLTGLPARAVGVNSVSRQAKRRCSCLNPCVQSYACMPDIASVPLRYWSDVEYDIDELMQMLEDQQRIPT